VATLLIIFTCFVCLAALTSRRSRCRRGKSKHGDRREADEPGLITKIFTNMTVRIDRPEEKKDFYRDSHGFVGELQEGDLGREEREDKETVSGLTPGPWHPHDPVALGP